MASRSLTASESGIAAIQNKLTAKKWSYEDLAKEAEMSRATAIGFCTGKPVDRKNFVTCCEALDLDWEVVSGQKEILSQPVEAVTDIDALVQDLRASSAESLRKRCGTMRILDMTQPIDSGAIYTDVNILTKIAGKTRREIQEMMADCGAEEFDRFFLGDVEQERVAGLKAVLEQRQLMILGRPGAGKTTFLKRLAIECLNGNFLADRLPVFVTLKEFAEAEGKPGILDCMGSDLTSLISILESGKALILLDGLDEVMEKDHDRIIREIREFAERYSQNHIVITCRIAAQEYILQQFTEVEMADFDDARIRDFADKWFKTKESDSESTTGKRFWQALQEGKPVKELATNPLLLTLLCLEFDHTLGFPQNRSELYERAISILLAKWDGQRRIKRDNLYKGLSLKRKETMLGQLAMYTFDQGDYFFKERVATGQIEQYIRNLPKASEDPEALLIDSRAVLKSIESQHGLLAERATGIYSFSHLTFHEYFVAKHILDLSRPAFQEAELEKLIHHVGEPRWKEVFLLTVERLDNADYLLGLMKQRIDSMMLGDELQQVLEWVQEKLRSIEGTCRPTAARSFYLTRELEINRDLDRNSNLQLSRNFALQLFHDLSRNRDRDSNNNLNLAPGLALDRNLVHALTCARSLGHTDNLTLALSRALDLALTLSRTLEDLAQQSELKQHLQNLQEQLPNRNHGQRFQQWWRHNGERWADNLRQLIMSYRDIGHDWRFTDDQAEKLRKYCAGNLLLFQCLNSECYVSREVREEIEATMLLSVAEIERWKRENRR
jgi:predicted NACHT family NTPase